MASQRWPRLVLLLPLASLLLLGFPPRAARAADLDPGDFVVGVRRPDPAYPYPDYLRGGQIVRVRGGVSTVFCDSSPAYYTQGFFHAPYDVVLDGQGRVVFLAGLGPSSAGTGDGFGLWRCDYLGATPTMIAAFGGGSALGYPQPVPNQAVCHAQGLHMKRVKGLDLNTGTASSSELYVVAINKACGTGPFESIAYDPVSGQWTESIEDPVPTAVAGPLDGFRMDMINANGFTFSVGNGGIRGVIEPIRLGFQIGEFSGGLVLQGTVDLINGQPGMVLWDDLTVPNVASGCPPDGIPHGTPYSHAAGGTKYGLAGMRTLAWRDGGLVVQLGPGFMQAPNSTNLALFTPDPFDDVSSLAHHDFGCQISKTLPFTPWHAFNSFTDSNANWRDVVRMTPDGRFGTQPQQLGRIVGLGPGDVTIYAEGLESPIGIDVYPQFVPTTSGVAVFFKIESPLNVLITASDGRRIGADLNTGAPINGFGSAGYDSQTTEPHFYGVRDPSATGFTIQTKGPGVGPYTITTYGANLASDVITQAQFTGTAAIGSESAHAVALDLNGRVTPTALACANGIDDDRDGKTDYQVSTSLRDYGCTGANDVSESGTAACDDGLDNDGDGRIDYRVAPALGDIGCSSHRSTIEAPQCQDGIDNDLATGIDFDGGASVNGGNPLAAPDPQCTAPTIGREAPATGGCGIGPELAGVFGLLAVARRWRREASIH